MDWYEDNVGGEFVPVIESGNSLRNKFIKLENAIDRDKPKNKPKNKPVQSSNRYYEPEEGKFDHYKAKRKIDINDYK